MTPKERHLENHSMGAESDPYKSFMVYYKQASGINMVFL